MTDRKGMPNPKRLKLDDLKRDNVFKAPDGYFDRLPAQIQERIKQPDDYGYRPVLVTSLKFALPVIILVAVIFQLDLFSPTVTPYHDPLALIDEVSSQDLVAYLGETDITTDEILEEIDINNMDLEFASQGMQLLNDFDLENGELDQILKEYDIEGDYL